MHQSVENIEAQLTNAEQGWYARSEHHRTGFVGRQTKHFDLFITPGVTGPMYEYILIAGTGAGSSRTGLESLEVLRRHQFVRTIGWGVDDPMWLAENIAEPGVAPDDTRRDAMIRVARTTSYVESRPPVSPLLSGDLVADVRSVTGLRSDELAELLHVSIGDLGRWRDEPREMPESHARFLQALRAIGAMLVGGLGASGVRVWLLRAPHPPLSALSEGRIDEIVARASAYGETLAT